MILGYTLTTFPKSHKTLMHNQSNRDLWHNCKRNKRNQQTNKTPPKCEQKDLATDPVQLSKCNEAFILNNPKAEKASTTDEYCTNPVQISKYNDVSNLTNCEAENTNTTDDSCTDPVQTSEIETVESLLEALKEDKSPSTEQDKEEIITPFLHDDDIVDFEINEWLTVDSWGNTPATEEMVLVDFEDL